MFHFFNRFSAELRDITLFHELLNKTGKAFHVIVGPTIDPETLPTDAGTRRLLSKPMSSASLPPIRIGLCMRPREDGWLLESEEDTARLGAALAARLQRGEAVCLSGPLGAGKSVLARALIRALSPGERGRPSPTYTLVQSYDAGRLPIAHFDLYRLRSAAEARELGMAEALETGAAVIEWPERSGRRPAAEPHGRDVWSPPPKTASGGSGSCPRRLEGSPA